MGESSNMVFSKQPALLASWLPYLIQHMGLPEFVWLHSNRELLWLFLTPIGNDTMSGSFVNYHHYFCLSIRHVPI